MQCCVVDLMLNKVSNYCFVSSKGEKKRLIQSQYMYIEVQVVVQQKMLKLQPYKKVFIEMGRPMIIKVGYNKIWCCSIKNCTIIKYM